MNITVPTHTTTDARRPGVPEGTGWSLVTDHGETMTIRLTDPTAETERWAVEQGYCVPDRVTRGRFFIALLSTDPAVHAWVKGAIQSDEQLELAASEPYFSRASTTVAGLRDQLQAAGYSQVTDDWIDELFREAFLLEL